MEVYYKKETIKLITPEKSIFERMPNSDKEFHILYIMHEYEIIARNFAGLPRKKLRDILCFEMGLKMSELQLKDLVDIYNERKQLQGQLGRLAGNYEKFDGKNCMCLCGYNRKSQELKDQIKGVDDALEKCELY